MSAEIGAKRFSIVVTGHNQRNFIRAAVESALAQPGHLREIIVVDDGSSDDSHEILRQYSELLQILRFPTRQGANQARNAGAALANGEYLVFLDGDDALTPWALEVYDRLVEERVPMLILGQKHWFEGRLPVVEPSDAPHRVQFVDYDTPLFKDRGIGLTASTVVVERHAFREVGGWTPSLFHMDLHDLITKLGFAGRMLMIRRPHTVFYRVHRGKRRDEVAPFLRDLRRLLEKDRAREYAGTDRHWFLTAAWFGGLAGYWALAGIQEGLYEEPLGLVACTWPLLAAAVIRRITLLLSGRNPIETLVLGTPQARFHVPLVEDSLVNHPAVTPAVNASGGRAYLDAAKRDVAPRPLLAPATPASGRSKAAHS